MRSIVIRTLLSLAALTVVFSLKAQTDPNQSQDNFAPTH